jgi:hypothetical protein
VDIERMSPVYDERRQVDEKNVRTSNAATASKPVYEQYLVKLRVYVPCIKENTGMYTVSTAESGAKPYLKPTLNPEPEHGQYLKYNWKTTYLVLIESGDLYPISTVESEAKTYLKPILNPEPT